jgi:DNA-directed RNA polymerase subunit RPC12/RpoP
MARQRLPKKLRFEIFKRDGFRCMYCGRTPPAVVLAIDHVIPVARGGDNETDNLVVACYDCNAGKGAVPLQSVPPTMQEAIDERAERADQMAAYSGLLMELRERESRTVEDIGIYYYDTLQGAKGTLTFGPGSSPNIRRFLQSLPTPEILDAIDITARNRDRLGLSDANTWRYFCGVCWRKIREIEGDGQ